VAVALDGHHVGDSHGAVAGHAADVVAPEVDQHHVLGPLLGVGQQLLGESAVLFLAGPAAARAGQRPRNHLAVDHADHDLRRAADQGHAGSAHVEHEGAGIDDPQRPVDLERVHADGHLQALAEDDLEDVAGADVLDALLDGRLELLAREVRLAGEIGRAFQGDVHRLQVAGVRGQLVDQGVDAAAGVVVGRAAADALVVEPGHGDHDDRLGHVIEDDHLIVEGEPQVGDLAVVVRGVGEVLEVADHVVAGVAHCAAAKRGQLGECDGAHSLHPPPQLLERVGALELPADEDRRAGGRNPGRGADRHPLLVGFDLEEGVRGEEAVAAHLLAADHALEQTCAAAGIELVEGGHRGERVAHQAAVDGHQVRPGCELRESLEIGIIMGSSGHGRRVRVVARSRSLPYGERASHQLSKQGLGGQFTPPVRLALTAWRPVLES